MKLIRIFYFSLFFLLANGYSQAQYWGGIRVPPIPSKEKLKKKLASSDVEEKADIAPIKLEIEEAFEKLLGDVENWKKQLLRSPDLWEQNQNRLSYFEENLSLLDNRIDNLKGLKSGELKNEQIEILTKLAKLNEQFYSHMP